MPSKLLYLAHFALLVHHDFYEYLARHELRIVFVPFYFLVGLTAGFTQRATLDPDLNEIHVLAVSIIPRAVSTRQSQHSVVYIFA